jgi:hypothetical protein
LEGLLTCRFLKKSTSFERTRKSGVRDPIQGISSYFMAKPTAGLYVTYSTELDRVQLLWLGLWIHTNKYVFFICALSTFVDESPWQWASLE